MTITVMYEARCSFCTATYSIGKLNIDTFPITKSNFITQLRIERWSVGKYVTCPDCVKDNINRRSRLKFPERRTFDTPSTAPIP